MLFFLLSWLISSFLNGLLFFGVFTFLAYWFYFKELPVRVPKSEPQFENFVLSQTLTDMINTNNDNTEGSSPRTNLSGNNESVIALNMIFQFLFQELKDTKGVRRYIIRKLSFEFNELLTTKAAGKFLQKISARDFSLGTSFPIIHNLKLQSYQLDNEKKTIQEMSAVVDLEYKNGFSLSIDADLILGRSAHVHIKIVSITGKARLQFTRHPFTHWNFAFIDEPKIEFDAASHFDGRQIPQLTQLILNQLRRSIRRKHTLPNYKCRYRPFFDQIYAQNLYKTDLDELLRKRSNSETTSDDPFGKDSDDTHYQMSDQSSKTKSRKNIEKPKSLTLKNKANLNSINTSYQYKKLCEKLGFDLTSKGKLTIKLQTCDRLPEALYSLNLPALNQQPQVNTQIVVSPKSTADSDTYVYITTSIDKVSMKSLMERQIYKDRWPLIEFELIKTGNDIGIIFADLFFINKNEVVIKKIQYDTTVSSSHLNEVKIFDIVHSVNQIRILNLKHLNKIVQRALVNSVLKFTLQRPCVLMENVVMTSSHSVGSSISSHSKIIKPDSIKPVETKINEPRVKTPVQASSSNNQNETLNTNSVTVLSNTSAQLIPAIAPVSASSPSVNALSTSLFPNTRLKIESLFSEKTKLKIFANSTPSSSPVNPEIVINEPGQNIACQSNPLPSSSSNLTNLNVNSTNQQTTPVTPQTSISASASSLVDYFSSASERPIGEELDLDIMSLLMNQTNENEKKRRTKYYYKRTKQIRLDRENVISFDNIPIDIDDSYTFDLNSNTKFLNVFLWTTQYLHKMTKVKNLLIGYISIPLYEINVDCWNTTKGETQSTVHFKPIDELKASAISKLTHSHVISDHPGFDSCLSVGSITMNFQHDLTKSATQNSLVDKNDSRENINENDGQEPDYLLDSNEIDSNSLTRNESEPRASTDSNQSSNSDTEPMKSKDLTEKIIEELVEQDKLKTEFKNELTNINNKYSKTSQADDGSIHKFSVITFNEMVMCEFCNRKIWLKKAYKCVYCNYIIHIKCYEKGIGKTICDRFYAKNGLKREPGMTVPKITIENDDAFVLINQSNPQLKVDDQKQSIDQLNSPSHASDSNLATPRSMVTSFLSGIRQRKWTPNEKTDANRGQENSMRPGFLSSLNLNLNTGFKKSNTNLNQDHAVSFDKNSLNLEYLNNMNNLDDNSSVSDLDEFKEIDTNEDKLYGTDLYEDLPLDERRAKFEEQILKYQSNIDMMSRLKCDLDKELEALVSVSTDVDKGYKPNLQNNKESQLRSQINHLEEQMKGVVFLLMQCQIGLETLGEPQIAAISRENSSDNGIPAVRKKLLQDEESDETSSDPLISNPNREYNVEDKSTN